MPLRHADPARAFAASLTSKMLEKTPEARPTIEEVWDFFRQREQSPLWERIRHERSDLLVAAGDTAHPLTVGHLRELPATVLDLRLAALDRDGAVLDGARWGRFDLSLLKVVVGRSDDEARAVLAERLRSLDKEDREQLLEAASKAAVDLVPAVEQLLTAGNQEPAVLAYLLRKGSARGSARLRALEKEAAKQGLSGGEGQAYIWSRSRFRADLAARLTELEVEILAQKELVEGRVQKSEGERTEWEQKLEWAVHFVRSRSPEEVQKRLADLSRDIEYQDGWLDAEQEEADARWADGADEVRAPFDGDERLGHQDALEKASLAYEALSAAAALLGSEPAALSPEEALRTVLAGLEARMGEEQQELERLVGEYVPLRKAELETRRPLAAAAGAGKGGAYRGDLSAPQDAESFLRRLGRLGERLRDAWRAS